jgi:hypothetical protein
MTQLFLTLFLVKRVGRGDCAAVNRRNTMTPTQIANLEAEYIQRARMAKEFDDHAIAATWEAAASLLIEAASKPACRIRRKLTTP